MATIENATLDDTGADPWPAVARAARQWLAGHAVEPRDAIVLLPFAALLVPARAAFGAGGVWMPRVETARTLADSLGPPPVPVPGEPCGDPVVDRLHAAALLRRLPSMAARERGDRRAFDAVVDRFAGAATELREAAAERPPAERAAWWTRVRDGCPPVAGPGALEASLLRAAVEWAAGDTPAPTDRLFAHRAPAWIVVRIGGADRLSEAVVAAAGVPALVIDLDRSAAPAPAARRWRCEGLEDEAEAAVAEIVEALDAGRAPVALVALDRVPVRRARALLERLAVPVVDETGWTLSTTHAATTLMSLLRAAAPAAGGDTLLAWLKQWPPALQRPRALQALEARLRGNRRPRDTDAAAAELLAQAQAHLAPFSALRERPLADWWALLQERLAADGTEALLGGDAAGVQLLQALSRPLGGAAGRLIAASSRFTLAGFTAWVDATLEGAVFLPPPALAAEVVLTPLARAIGRPFGHVVVPAADATHLGPADPTPSLLPPALAESLGLQTPARRRERQRAAFLQLLRVPSLALLRRRHDGEEPLAASPEVLAAAAAHAWPAEADWRPALQRVDPRPAARPQPVASADLPELLSATQVEALRDCPYRFFARAVLRLAEPDEIEAAFGKRDLGTWLHGVLHRFHRTRGAPETDAERLAQAADEEARDQGLAADEMLPFRASFERLAPAYLRWLAGRDAEGWTWLEGEADREAAPPALAPQRLRGRLDRLDRHPGGGLQVIDYKTGSAEALKRKVREPLEDTQLAFYAALQPGVESALYLALDDADAPLPIEHPGVAASAEELVRQVGAEMARLRAGAPMPALGEEPLCEHCEARGLCRRDHWSGP